MSKSPYPSVVALPDREKPYPSIQDFLIERFPKIDRHTWIKRVADGKVHDEHGEPVADHTPYVPGKKIFYFREVDREPVIPFKETILYSDDQILVACKPHFLPVIPGGAYVNECLVNRLRNTTGNHDLSPVNRIDLDTAGIVLFSCNRETRGLYHNLFTTGTIEKTYEAVTVCPAPPESNQWVIKNRMTGGTPWFHMKIIDGEANAVTRVHFIKSKNQRAMFRLNPITGKKHQLRLHLSNQGYAILNDRFYPDLLPEGEPDFTAPLQLLARRITFRDPVSNRLLEFESDRRLSESF